MKTLGIKYLAADSYYSKSKFVHAVTKLDLHIIGKLRVDANLKWLYDGEYTGSGRPRKYDGKVDFKKDINRFGYVATVNDTSHVYSAIVYSVSLKKDVRIVLLTSTQLSTQGGAVLFSTDTTLDPLTLLSYYKARFQIEFLFRDAKQYTGLTQCQSRHAQAIENQVNASLTALNLLKIEDRNHKKSDKQTVISIASWKRRKANQHLLSRVFDKLDLDIESNKMAAIYRELSDYGVIAA